MNRASEKRLLKLHPSLATAVRAAVADLNLRGHVVEVVQGLRSFEEQDALFAQGRTKPGSIVTQARGGESNHNYGLAADLCPFVGGKPDWNAPIAVWSAIGAAAVEQGLAWGGNWQKFIDKPHVELTSLTLAECQSIFRNGGMNAVWTAATDRLTQGTARAWLDVAAAATARANGRPRRARAQGKARKTGSKAKPAKARRARRPARRRTRS